MAEQTLEEFFSGDQPPVDELELMSRRKFLTGAVAGGAAGLAVAAGTGAAVWKVTDAELLAAKQAAEAELVAAQEAAGAEVARLQGLVDLYEGLEKIGLDAILETGIMALALPMKAVEGGAKTLKAGLDWAEGALVSLAEALPTAQESLLWLERQVTAVAEGIERLETSVARALDRVGDNPVAETVRDFGSTLLDYLPFGLGDRFRAAFEGLVALITSVDDLVQGINTHLLEPLNEKWFSAQDGQGVGGTFVDPLVEHILDPLESHLVNLAVLADNWQKDLMAPTQEALAERAKIRAEIGRYKDEHGLG
jgi:hypothetical protein